VTEYEYNDRGFRVSQTIDGVKTVYLVDAQNHTGYTQVLEEKDAAGNVTKTFTLGLDVVTQASIAAVYHLLYDVHGSTCAVVDGAGDAQQFFAYDAYGELLELTGFVSALETALTSLLYSGEFRDASTGWDFLRARWMQNGRFNRMDPFAGDFLNPQSLNKYGYVHGDPVNGIDPSGEIYALLLRLAIYGLLAGFGTYVGISRFSPATFGRIQLNAITARSSGPSTIQNYKTANIATINAAGTYPRANIGALLDEYAIKSIQELYLGVVSRRCDFATVCLLDEQKLVNSTQPRIRSGITFRAGDIQINGSFEADNILVLLPDKYANLDSNTLGNPAWYNTVAKRQILVFYVGSVPFVPVTTLYDAVVNDSLGNFEGIFLYEKDTF